MVFVNDKCKIRTFIVYIHTIISLMNTNYSIKMAKFRFVKFNDYQYLIFKN